MCNFHPALLCNNHKEKTLFISSTFTTITNLPHNTITAATSINLFGAPQQNYPIKNHPQTKKKACTLEKTAITTTDKAKGKIHKCHSI